MLDYLRNKRQAASTLKFLVWQISLAWYLAVSLATAKHSKEIQTLARWFVKLVDSPFYTPLGIFSQRNQRKWLSCVSTEDMLGLKCRCVLQWGEKVQRGPCGMSTPGPGCWTREWRIFCQLCCYPPNLNPTFPGTDLIQAGSRGYVDNRTLLPRR